MASRVGKLGSPHGSSVTLGGGAAYPGTGLPPRTPESALTAGSRSRSARSGSATPSEDMSMSMASAATSFASAADLCLFAPASTEDAVHAVPALLSQLLSGRTDEQILAARKLHAYCRHCGRPVEAAIIAAGGTHMLLIMLDSLDRSLRDVCTRLLTDLAADDRVRAEILSSPGGTAKVIQLMYKGILDGQASAGRFLELLAGSKDEAVQAALCHSKVVRMLCRTLEGAPTPRARGAALAALQAFCRQDSANLRKLVWSGGVGALLGVLQAADAPAAQQAAALQLLGAAVALQADAAASLAAEDAIAALAQFVGAPEQPLAQQADAADILVRVAAVPVKRAGAQQALTDHVLPRAFEIVHEAAAGQEEAAAAGGSSAAGGGSGGAAATDASASPEAASLTSSLSSSPAVAAAMQAAAPGGGDAAAATAQRRRLQAAAAAIVAQLVQQDAECCHSILLHAQLLRPAVRMLITGGRCAAAQQLLAAAKAYAAGLGKAAGTPSTPRGAAVATGGSGNGSDSGSGSELKAALA